MTHGWVGAALVAMLAAGTARAQGGSTTPKGVPAFRAMVATLSGSYHDTSINDAKATSRNQPKTKLTGTEVQLAGTYKVFDFELGQRLLAPQSVSWFKRRSETELSTGYFWARFPQVQPMLGIVRETQTGNQEDPDAPPAFIDSNTAVMMGLRSHATLYSFGTHGILGQGQITYNTTFEKKRNFGDEGYAGLGYFFQTGRFRGSLIAGQLRNFFRAEKPDPDVDDAWLTVRHVYVVNRIGLYIEY